MFSKRDYKKNEQALSQLKVIEYSRDISGSYCAKLLADFGAEVIKIEKPLEGHATRRIGPFPKDIPHAERSGLHLYLNTNKMGITLNLETHTGAEIFRKLAISADIVIEDYPPGTLDKFGVGYSSLSALKPDLIMTSITPFGQTGPYHDYHATDLVTFQMGGIGYETPPSVKAPEQEPPIKFPEEQTEFVAGLTSATATLMAIYDRDLTGRGHQIDISHQDAIASLAGMSIAQYSHEKAILPRDASRLAGLVYLLPCQDGFICAEPISPDHWPRLMKFIGNPSWANDERFKDRDSRKQNADELKRLLSIWSKNKRKNEIVEEAQKRGIPITPVNTPIDLVKSEQLSARNFFVNIAHSESGETTLPGAPFKLSETPWMIRYPAPLLGEHNEELFLNRLGYSKYDLVKLYEAGVI